MNSRLNQYHFSLILIVTFCISACSNLPSSSVVTSTSAAEEVHTNSNQSTEQIGQIQAQLNALQIQINGLQNQMNDIRQQQDTLSRYLNVRTPVSHTTPVKASATNDNTSEARRLYNAGLYSQSIRLLKNADSGGNGSAQAQERMWLLLQNHSRLNNCESVINIGKRFNSLYPQNSQSANALYLVAQCQTHLQQQDIARLTYQHIISSYPNSNAAVKARHQLKNLLPIKKGTR